MVVREWKGREGREGKGTGLRYFTRPGILGTWKNIMFLSKRAFSTHVSKRGREGEARSVYSCWKLTEMF